MFFTLKMINKHEKIKREKISNSLKGHKVSNITRMKISNSLKGKTYIEKFGLKKANELKKRLSKNLKENNPMNNKIFKEKYMNSMKINVWNNKNRNQKISDKHKGKVFTDEHKNKLKLSHIGKKNSQESKEKNRILAIKYIKEKCGGIRPNIGKNEKKILDEIELSLGYKITRQYPCCGYFIDGYCKELNLAIEVDELFHKKRIKEDKNRENNIKKELNCIFVRIKDYE